jgi:hypothetical protein
MGNMQMTRRQRRNRIKALKTSALCLAVVIAAPVTAVILAVLLMPQSGFDMYARAIGF